MTLIALSLVIVFSLLSLLHVYWAFGGRAGWVAIIPEVNGLPAFRPGIAITLVVAAGLEACAALVATAAGFLPSPVPPWLVRFAMHVLALVFFLRAIGDFRLVGFTKRVRGSRFARLDTLVYSPLCLAIAAGVLAIARA
jgi:hypothetical protein